MGPLKKRRVKNLGGWGMVLGIQNWVREGQNSSATFPPLFFNRTATADCILAAAQAADDDECINQPLC